MRYLPPSFVVHRKVIEANQLALAPITLTLDDRPQHLARPETVQAYTRMAKDAQQQDIHLKILWAYRSAQLQKEQFEVLLV